MFRRDFQILAPKVCQKSRRGASGRGKRVRFMDLDAWCRAGFSRSDLVETGVFLRRLRLSTSHRKHQGSVRVWVSRRP